MPILVPKIVWPSAGANELLFAFPPVGVRPFDRAGRRHDTIASSGRRQSLLERTDKFLELDITLVPTEVENYLTRTEEFDHADWIKAGTPSVPVVTADQVANPQDGAINADQIAFPATGAGQQSSVVQDAFSRLPDLTGRTVVYSIWLRADTPPSPNDLSIQIFDGIGGGSLTTIITTGWQRFSVFATINVGATEVRCFIFNSQNKLAKTVFAWGAQLGYDVVGPYIKTQGAIPAAIDRWDTFITAVLDGTNFDYFPDAFAAGFTTYVLEDKAWRPKLQIRGANRFYEFKLRLREFV